MIIIGKIENRTVILLMALFIIIIISFLDYITGTELSFSIFYLVPISLLALYRGTMAVLVLASSVFASVLWFIVEYYSRNYSNLFFPVWNAFVRLIIFSAIGLLLWFLKEKDKKLNSINRDLKNINEEKNKFIGVAAHDLRSPVSVIYSFADLLISEYKKTIHPEVLEIVNHIKTISSDTLVVMQNLLDVSKIESGKIELKIKTQDYTTFVKQQILLNQFIAKNKNINIHLDSKAEIIILDFDNHYLSEVIDNLLTNAIKYSDKNSNIIVKISQPKNDQILTEVIDEGKGIPEEEQQKLFKYFQTTSIKTTAGEKSTGLGLAIAKHIVNLHHGEIGVKSTQNKGSNFYFILPVRNISA